MKGLNLVTNMIPAEDGKVTIDCSLNFIGEVSPAEAVANLAVCLNSIAQSLLKIPVGAPNVRDNAESPSSNSEPAEVVPLRD